MDAYMVCRDEDSGLEFRWHGGEYIDVGYVQAQGVAGIDGDDFHAYDVINVWDYEKGEPRIPRTLEAFETRCREKLAEPATDEDRERLSETIRGAARQ